mgnify:CR=1 FL=1
MDKYNKYNTLLKEAKAKNNPLRERRCRPALTGIPAPKRGAGIFSCADAPVVMSVPSCL